MGKVLIGVCVGVGVLALVAAFLGIREFSRRRRVERALEIEQNIPLKSKIGGFKQNESSYSDTKKRYLK